jgi:hypothetical protein
MLRGGEEEGLDHRAKRASRLRASEASAEGGARRRDAVAPPRQAQRSDEGAERSPGGAGRRKRIILSVAGGGETVVGRGLDIVYISARFIRGWRGSG